MKKPLLVAIIAVLVIVLGLQTYLNLRRQGRVLMKICSMDEHGILMKKCNI